MIWDEVVTWVSSALHASFLTTMALNLERIVKFLTGVGSQNARSNLILG